MPCSKVLANHSLKSHFMQILLIRKLQMWCITWIHHPLILLSYTLMNEQKASMGHFLENILIPVMTTRKSLRHLIYYAFLHMLYLSRTPDYWIAGSYVPRWPFHFYNHQKNSVHMAGSSEILWYRFSHCGIIFFRHSRMFFSVPSSHDATLQFSISCRKKMILCVKWWCHSSDIILPLNLCMYRYQPC